VENCSTILPYTKQESKVDIDDFYLNTEDNYAIEGFCTSNDGVYKVELDSAHNKQLELNDKGTFTIDGGTIESNQNTHAIISATDLYTFLANNVFIQWINDIEQTGLVET